MAMAIKERCIVCRVSFRPGRAEQRLCGEECRCVHRKRLARQRRRRDLERFRTAERERQARHRDRAREAMTTAPTAVPEAAAAPGMSRARSDLEAVEIVQEIQKKLAGLERCVARMSRARSTPQHADSAKESAGFRG